MQLGGGGFGTECTVMMGRNRVKREGRCGLIRISLACQVLDGYKKWEREKGRLSQECRANMTTWSCKKTQAADMVGTAQVGS